MKLIYIYIHGENAALKIKDILILLLNNSSLSIDCIEKLKLDAKTFLIPDIISKQADFQSNVKLPENIDLTLYTTDKNNYSILIRKDKFRFFYSNTGFLSSVDQKINDIIYALKQHFLRRPDLVILPLHHEKDPQVNQFLKHVKPRYFAPLLPDNDYRVLEKFIKTQNLENTGVLTYTKPCETFEFNLF